jgi:small subunit ribosomal protein S16
VKSSRARVFRKTVVARVARADRATRATKMHPRLAISKITPDWRHRDGPARCSTSSRPLVDARPMPVRIRLARVGARNAPRYRVFVADSRAPRDGKHIEIVGHYDPIAQRDGHKHVGLNIERIKYWLSVGAQPSETVARLLGQAGVIPALPRRGSAASRGFAASGG